MKAINFKYLVMLVVQKCTVTAEKNDNKAILLSFLSKQPNTKTCTMICMSGREFPIIPNIVQCASSVNKQNLMM